MNQWTAIGRANDDGNGGLVLIEEHADYPHIQRRTRTGYAKGRGKNQTTITFRVVIREASMGRLNTINEAEYIGGFKTLAAAIREAERRGLLAERFGRLG